MTTFRALAVIGFILVMTLGVMVLSPKCNDAYCVLHDGSYRLSPSNPYRVIVCHGKETLIDVRDGYVCKN